MEYILGNGGSEGEGSEGEGSDEATNDDKLRLVNKILLGGASEQEKALWKFYTDHCIHEILSFEFIDELSKALLTEQQALLTQQQALLTLQDETSEGGKFTILELGAGSGVLASHLTRHVDSDTVTIVACDNFSSGIPTKAGCVTVDTCGYEEALDKYKPDVVLVSWMPSGVDFTAAIRKTKEVRQYVLVGEVDSSTCGDRWATWGVVPEIGCKRCKGEGCERCDLGVYEDTAKEWKGWEREELTDVSRLSICRFDCAGGREGGWSKTVRFTREM